MPEGVINQELSGRLGLNFSLSFLKEQKRVDLAIDFTRAGQDQGRVITPSQMPL